MRWSICLLVPALFVLGACSSGEDVNRPVGDGAPAHIGGEVFYRERIMLPPGAEVEVQLEDISRPDAPATVLSSQRLVPQGGPPYQFRLEYDPGRVDPRLRYALRARIEVEGKLMFTNTDYIDAFGESPVKVLVQRVPSTDP